MPDEVALATTKRKFYKALDTFTTDSQISLTPSTASSTTTAKRSLNPKEAFEEAIERTSKRLRHSTSSSSLPLKVTAVPAAAPKKADSISKSRDPPNYSPWSHETFLARLQTFSRVTIWHSKPDAIGEVEWAKRGWVCVDVNTVACKGGCEKRVVVSLELAEKQNPQQDSDEDVDEEDSIEDDDALEQALANRYKEEIVSGHAPNCLWRQSGCKDDIYHLQVIRPSIWQPELKQRFQSTFTLRTDIENVTLRTAGKDEAKVLSTASLLKDLVPEVIGESPASPTPSITAQALEIALHGWRGSTENRCALLHCDACFHRIGLWMYQPGYRPRGLIDEDETDEERTTIDLVEMHREHCPWRNADMQRAAGIMKGLNACQILQRVVSTYAKDCRRRSIQQRAATTTPLGASPGLDGVDEVEPPVLSKEEVARQDKERESRLRKIKNLFSMRRRPKDGLKAAVPAAKS